MNETKSESIPLSRDGAQAVRGVAHCKGIDPCLHQYQREVETVTHDGKALACIEASLEDIAAANRSVTRPEGTRSGLNAFGEIRCLLRKHLRAGTPQE